MPSCYWRCRAFGFPCLPESWRLPPLVSTTGPLEAAGRCGAGDGCTGGGVIDLLKEETMFALPPAGGALKALIMEVITLAVGCTEETYLVGREDACTPCGYEHSNTTQLYIQRTDTILSSCLAVA